MNVKNILVLGSKPSSMLPDIKVDKIYTANGSAERAHIYKQKYSNIPLTCLCGAKNFDLNDNVSQRIIKSEPQLLYIRSGKINLPHALHDKVELKCVTNTSQWHFQKKFFNYGLVSLLISECYYHEHLMKKIAHIKYSILKKEFQGVSTGFYAILLALEENPDSNIIISGVGMIGGKRYYKSEINNIFDYDKRARVDRYLLDKLKKNFKNKLYSVDDDLIRLSNIKKWQGSTFDSKN